MKSAFALSLVAGSASAFSMTMMAKGPVKGPAKGPAKPAGPVVKKSIALPYTTTTLDTGLAGDFGFDPFGYASRESKFAPFDTLKWYREAELQHGRVAMLAFTGFVWPALFGSLPSAPGYDYSEVNDPIQAFYTAPPYALGQIFLFVAALEGRRYQRNFKGDAAPGDANIGVPGGWNPLKLNYSAEEYAEKELQEIKHCRLAMLGAIGALWQNSIAGEGVVAQLSTAFAKPDFVAKAGYYFPDGL
jgi:hypothetical protein